MKNPQKASKSEKNSPRMEIETICHPNDDWALTLKMVSLFGWRGFDSYPGRYFFTFQGFLWIFYDFHQILRFFFHTFSPFHPNLKQFFKNFKKKSNWRRDFLTQEKFFCQSFPIFHKYISISIFLGMSNRNLPLFFMSALSGG